MNPRRSLPAALTLLVLLAIALGSAEAQRGSRRYKDSASGLVFVAPSGWHFDEPGRREERIGFQAVLEDSTERRTFPYIGVSVFTARGAQGLRREADDYAKRYLSKRYKNLRTVREQITQRRATLHYTFKGAQGGRVMHAVSIFRKQGKYTVVATWVGPEKRFQRATVIQLLTRIVEGAAGKDAGNDRRFRDRTSGLVFLAPNGWHFDDPTRREERIGFEAVLEDEKERKTYPYIGISTFPARGAQSMQRQADSYAGKYLRPRFKQIRVVKETIRGNYAMLHYRFAGKARGSVLHSISVFRKQGRNTLVATWIGSTTRAQEGAIVRLLDGILTSAKPLKP